MSKIIIQNRAELTKYPHREEALSIIEAGLNAIDTEKVITSSLAIEGDTLRVKDLTFDLTKFKRLRLIGFGKASCEATTSVEKVLGNRITDGAIIDIKSGHHEFVLSLVGTHPRASLQNVVATKKILDIFKDTNADDLVLVIVSGGGSALLCGTEEECTQGERIYSEFIKTGGNIDELNTVRKHLSMLKGGGLAKVLYPATVVGMIFCDIPGGTYEETASGPTTKDKTTINDAQVILDKYNLKDFILNETPKEDMYFEKVHNVLMVSNRDALDAMEQKTKELGYEAKILSASIYEPSEEVIHNFKNLSAPHRVVMGGGEVGMTVKGGGGSGGRCAYMGMQAIAHIEEGEMLVAIASDGLDNSPAAGVIVDKNTVARVAELKIDTQDYLNRYDAYNFFQKVGDLVVTGQTGANVSDLMLWIKQ